MSPLPPCLRLNLVHTAALSPHPLLYAQVKTHTLLPHLGPPLQPSHQTFSLRTWRMSGAWLCAQQSIPGGLSIPNFPASFPAEKRPGHPLKH